LFIKKIPSLALPLRRGGDDELNPLSFDNNLSFPLLCKKGVRGRIG
jgi:hypothetical protein